MAWKSQNSSLFVKRRENYLGSGMQVLHKHTIAKVQTLTLCYSLCDLLLLSFWNSLNPCRMCDLLPNIIVRHNCHWRICTFDWINNLTWLFFFYDSLGVSIIFGFGSSNHTLLITMDGTWIENRIYDFCRL